MKQWCIVKKSRLTDALKDGNDPKLLNSGQYLVRVTKNNEYLLHGYKRYDFEDLKDKDLDTTNSHKEKEDISNSPFKDKKVCNDHRLFKRLHGSDFIPLIAGATEILELTIGYAWAKIEAMEVIGAGKQHTCNLIIVDTDTGAFSGVPDAVLNQFCFDAAVAENFHRFASKYDADLYLGMGVQLEITNHSTIDSVIALNLELNEVVK